MSLKRPNLLIKIFASFILVISLLFITACTPEIEIINVESVTVSSAGNASTVTTFHGTLQLSAVVLPADAWDLTVTWSVINGTGSASISSNGLLTAISNGIVTVKATSNGDEEIFGTKVITISNQEVVVASVAVSSADDATTIATFGGTLQMSALVLPANAADKSVIWSVVNGTGTASISTNGLLTALTNGTVTVRATSVSNSSVFGIKVITIGNQEVLVTSISVASAGNLSFIDSFHGTLQMSAVVLPANAADDSVTWSVTNGTGTATISATGLLTAATNGTVTVRATSNENSEIFGTKEITLSNQEVVVASVEVSSAGNATEITTFHGTLQMNVLVLPANAVDMTVTWSVTNGTGSATISATGLLTAASNGTVTVKATSNQNALMFDEMVITLSHQEVVVASVTVTGAANAVTIATFAGTLQMSALVLPANAVNKAITWSVINGTGSATINASGLLTAVANGTVTVRATSNENPLIYGNLVITISHQEVVVVSVAVSAAGDASEIATFHGTLQMSALVLPANAANKAITWSVVNGTGTATIDAAGLLTAATNGTVTVKATSVENGLIYGTKVITLSNQEVLVSSITVSSVGDLAVIDVIDGTLQMTVVVLPANAEDDSVVWSVTNGTGSASISLTGLLTALTDGTVTVTATSVSTPSIFGTKEITISNQVVVVPPEPIVELGLAGDFVILAKTAISTTSGSLITGNIGVSPVAASFITGFSLIADSTNQFATSVYVVGMVYAADYAVPTPTYLTTAVSNMETAYTDAAGRAPDFTNLYAGNISGQTLVAGVYVYGTDLLINTNVTLTGSATDVWIFQIAGSLTQAAGAQVLLSGGALAENIFWQVAGDVAIGTGAHFEGTILCMTMIAVGTNASVNGRLYSQTAVTLDANVIN